MTDTWEESHPWENVEYTWVAGSGSSGATAQPGTGSSPKTTTDTSTKPSAPPPEYVAPDLVIPKDSVWETAHKNLEMVTPYTPPAPALEIPKDSVWETAHKNLGMVTPSPYFGTPTSQAPSTPSPYIYQPSKPKSDIMTEAEAEAFNVKARTEYEAEQEQIRQVHLEYLEGKEAEAREQNIQKQAELKSYLEEKYPNGVTIQDLYNEKILAPGSGTWSGEARQKWGVGTGGEYAHPESLDYTVAILGGLQEVAKGRYIGTFSEPVKQLLTPKKYQLTNEGLGQPQNWLDLLSLREEFGRKSPELFLADHPWLDYDHMMILWGYVDTEKGKTLADFRRPTTAEINDYVQQEQAERMQKMLDEYNRVIKEREEAKRRYEEEKQSTSVGETKLPNWDKYNIAVDPETGKTYDVSDPAHPVDISKVIAGYYQKQWLKEWGADKGIVSMALSPGELSWLDKLFGISPVSAAPPESKYEVRTWPTPVGTSRQILWQANDKWYGLAYDYTTGEFVGFSTGDSINSLRWEYSTPTNPINPEDALKCTSESCSIDDAELKMGHDFVKLFGFPTSGISDNRPMPQEKLPDEMLTRNEYGIVLDAVAANDVRYARYVNRYEGLTYVDKASMGSIMNPRKNEFNIIILGTDSCPACANLAKTIAGQGLIGRYDNINFLYADYYNGGSQLFKESLGMDINSVPYVIITNNGQIIPYENFMGQALPTASGSIDGLEYIRQVLDQQVGQEALKQIEKPPEEVPAVSYTPAYMGKEYTTSLSKDKTKLTIEWTTDKPTIGQVMLCNPDGLCTWTEPEFESVSKHRLTIDVEPDKVYHMTLKDTDNQGNEKLLEDNITIKDIPASAGDLWAEALAKAVGKYTPFKPEEKISEVAEIKEPEPEKPSEPEKEIPGISEIKPDIFEDAKARLGQVVQEIQQGSAEIKDTMTGWLKTITPEIASNFDYVPSPGIKGYTDYATAKNILMAQQVTNSPYLTTLKPQIESYIKGQETVFAQMPMPEGNPTGEMKPEGTKALSDLVEQGYSVFMNPAKDNQVWITRPDGSLVQSFPDMSLKEIEQLAEKHAAEVEEFNKKSAELQSELDTLDKKYGSNITEQEGELIWTGDEATLAQYNSECGTCMARQQELEAEGAALDKQYEDLTLGSVKLDQSNIAKKTVEYVKAHPAEFAVGFVPVAGTAVLWGKMSPAEKGISVLADALFFIPAVKGVSAGVRAGLSPSRALARVALAEVKMPAIAITHPKATFKAMVEPAVTALHPKRIPIEATEIRSYILKLPISRVGDVSDTLRARDVLTRLAESGEKPVLSINGKEIELATTALQTKNLGGVAAHTTPDLRPFLNGATVSIDKEGRLFVAPNLNTRYTIASATGKGFTPEPVASAWEWTQRHIERIGQYSPDDIIKLDTPAIRKLNFADAKNIPENLAIKLEAYFKQADGKVYGSFNEWLKVKSAPRPEDIDIAVKDAEKAINDVMDIAQKAGYQARRVEHGVEILKDGKWVKLGDIVDIAKHDAGLQAGLIADAPVLVDGIKVEKLGEQYIRQAYGAVEGGEKAGARAKHVLKMSSKVEDLIREAGYTKKMPGALIIRDEEILKTLKSSKQIYHGTAEIESVFEGALPAPSQILEATDVTGKTMSLFVIGKPYSRAELLQLKIMGSIDTVRDIFRPAVKINDEAVKLADELSDIEKEARGLKARISIAREAGDTAEVRRLTSELDQLNARAGRIAERLNLARVAPSVPLRPLFVSLDEPLDIANYRALARENPQELARYLSTIPESDRVGIIETIPEADRARVTPLIERSVPTVSRVTPDTEIPRMPVRAEVPRESRIPKRLEVPRVPVMPERATVPRQPVVSKVEIPRVPRVPERPTTVPATKIPPKKLPCKSALEKFEELTTEQRLGSIAWKQGWAYHLIYPPYGQENILHSKQPFPGVKVASGPQSAYESVARVQGAALPDEVWHDLGIVNVGFKRDAKSGDPVIGYVGDKYQTIPAPPVKGMPGTVIRKTTKKTAPVVATMGTMR